MVEIGNVKEVIKDYIIKQLVSMGESSPAIRLLTPLAKRAITNNINSFDKFLKPIADKDGMIDIEGIFDEEMEVINNIDNFNFDIPYCKTIKGNYLRIVPFFIYLNFSMDKFIDVIVDGILSNFDFGFMFIVNVLTYIIIKVIDYFNGDNKVPTWQKRCVLVISIVTMAGIYIAAGYDNAIMLVNSAVLAPVFWSWVVSPILKKLGVGYKDIDNTIG